MEYEQIWCTSVWHLINMYQFSYAIVIEFKLSFLIFFQFLTRIDCFNDLMGSDGAYTPHEI